MSKKRKEIVGSTAITAVEYDTKEKSLKVFMRDGTSPVYHDVPVHEYNMLITAASTGRYYNEHIRNSYSVT